jgi:hypothetical protein
MKYDLLTIQHKVYSAFNLNLNDIKSLAVFYKIETVVLEALEVKLKKEKYTGELKKLIKNRFMDLFMKENKKCKSPFIGEIDVFLDESESTKEATRISDKMYNIFYTNLTLAGISDKLSNMENVPYEKTFKSKDLINKDIKLSSIEFLTIVNLYDTGYTSNKGIYFEAFYIEKGAIILKPTSNKFAASLRIDYTNFNPLKFYDESFRDFRITDFSYTSNKDGKRAISMIIIAK